MDDDLYERYAKGAADAAGRAAFAKGLEIGIEIGQTQGMAAGLIVGRQQGRAEGVVLGLKILKEAVSDGTRRGSSKCARALEGYKRLGVTDEE